MQKLFEQSSYKQIDKALRFASIRLKSHSTTKDLAAGVDQVRANLQQHHENWLQIREERIAASAFIEYLDSLLDGAVMALVRDILNKVDNDRTHPLYKNMFATVPSTAMAPLASVEQSRYVDIILDKLETKPEYVDYANAKEEIAAKLADLQEKLAERHKFYVKEGTATSDRISVMDEARLTYNMLYPRLQLMFPKQPKLVESFFI